MTAHVVLVGLMGAGKTTVGAALAPRLGRRFVDGDAQLAAIAGRDAARVASESGVDALHRLEARALREALTDPDPKVIAAAASVVDDPACRQALTGEPTVVWLDAPDEVLAARLGAGPHRRTLGADQVASLAAQRTARGTHYAAIADLVVSTATAPVQETVDTITAHLG